MGCENWEKKDIYTVLWWNWFHVWIKGFIFVNFSQEYFFELFTLLYFEIRVLIYNILKLTTNIIFGQILSQLPDICEKSLFLSQK